MVPAKEWVRAEQLVFSSAHQNNMFLGKEGEGVGKI